MIDQIRHLQSARPFETFAIELDNGRVIQIHDPHTVATVKHPGLIGILSGSGVFEVIDAQHVVAVSVGVHEQTVRQIEKRRAEFEERFGPSKSS